MNTRNDKCCEKCNINTASFSYRQKGHEPNAHGCINPVCSCHAPKEKGWREQLQKAKEVAPAAFQPLYDNVKDVVEDALTQQKREIVEAITQLEMKAGFMPLGVSNDPWNKALRRALKAIDEVDPK